MTSVAVSCPGRTIRVGFARERGEFEQAFRLLAAGYRARGYAEPGDQPYRFTPHHVLPDTATAVARDGGTVVATLSLVPDTGLLGLPMEAVYRPEVEALRGAGRRLGEITSLADRDLAPREFLRVFMGLIRLTFQAHVRRGGDTWVFAVNPRHSLFYRKVIGAEPLGPRRSYASVNDHPAEAFWLDRRVLQANAPAKFQEFFGEDLPGLVLENPARPAGHVRYFVGQSDLSGRRVVEDLVRAVELLGSPPRWLE
jgi:hypothetical protein